jgi:tetratricopeptide (TPR) repeat protein
MKMRTLFFLFFALILVSNLVAQTPDEMMDNANSLYQKNDFTGAQKVYKELLDNGYQSAVLYYNLGNAHYRMGDLGYAIYYYEKALKLAPGDEDIIHNIKIANSRTVDKINEVPKIFITRWWDGLVVSLSANGWSFVLLLVFALFLFYLGLYLLTKKNSLQRIAFYSGSGVLAVLILVLIIWLARLNIETSENFGILLDKNATVKVSPDVQSNDAFMLHEGIKFSLEEKMNGWYKIKLADGKLGWLPQNSVGKI